jgi:hypothetical protein
MLQCGQASREWQVSLLRNGRQNNVVTLGFWTFYIGAGCHCIKILESNLAIPMCAHTTAQ